MKKLIITKLLEKYQPDLIGIFGSYGRKNTGYMLSYILSSNKTVLYASSKSLFSDIENHLGGYTGILSSLFFKRKFPDVLIVETNSPSNVMYQYVKNILGLGVAVILPVGDIPSFTNVYAGPDKGVVSIMREASSADKVISVIDDETIRDGLGEVKSSMVTIGFDEHADVSIESTKNILRIGDNISGGVQMKIQYNGSFMPIYLANHFGKRNIYSACVALIAASYYDVNLIQGAERLSSLKPNSGFLDLVMGVKNTALVSLYDDITPFSTREAIELVGELHSLGMARRVVLVLGDILTHKEGEIEGLYRMLGELCAKNSSLLFLAGDRTIFTEEEAQKNGMLKSNIYRHATILEAANNAKKHIKERDLVIVISSKELNPEEAVKELVNI